METIEAHGRTYRVYDGTYYDNGTPDEVVAVLDRARQSGHASEFIMDTAHKRTPTPLA